MPSIGGMATWVLGSALYLTTGKLGVFGLGYGDLSAVLNNNFVWWIAGIMVIAKLLATIVSYGFGGCGGIFSPLLFIGGMCGYFIAGLVGLEVPLTVSDRVLLSVVGMSACLGTVVRAPLSAMLIVFEMTHQFSLVPSLLLGMFTSMLVARLAGSVNFYDAILMQDGHELHKIRPPQDMYSWQALPISAIANPSPAVLDGLGAECVKSVLTRYPYHCFPVVIDGALRGIVTREALTKSIKDGGEPRIAKAAICSPNQTVHEATARFLESPEGIIVLAEEGSGKLVGLLTLHDILRAQAAISD